MKRSSVIASVLSLILVGTSGVSLAESNSSSAQKGQIELLGMSLCTAAAPADAKCDIDLRRVKIDSKHVPKKLTFWEQVRCLADSNSWSYCKENATARASTSSSGKRGGAR